MKFAEFLEEKSSTGDYEISSLIAWGYVPLSTSMMDRLGYSYEDEAFHMTSPQYLEDLKDLQGSRKQISAFTIGGNELMKLPSNPTVLVKLEGNLVIDAASDMWTAIDKKGQRWISLQDASEKSGSKAGERLRFFTLGIKDTIVKSLGYEPSISMNMMPNKDKIKLYKLYKQKIEKYLETGGYKLLNDHLKGNITYSYNEVIMNKIKILGAYSLDNSSKKSDIEKSDIKYLGVMSMQDLAKIGK